MRYYESKYICNKCRNIDVKFLEAEKRVAQILCTCGNMAMLEDNSATPVRGIHQACFVLKGRDFPYYDECLDRVIKSPSDKKSYLKERGLEQIGLQHERNRYEKKNR